MVSGINKESQFGKSYDILPKRHFILCRLPRGCLHGAGYGGSQSPGHFLKNRTTFPPVPPSFLLSLGTQSHVPTCHFQDLDSYQTKIIEGGFRKAREGDRHSLSAVTHPTFIIEGLVCKGAASSEGCSVPPDTTSCKNLRLPRFLSAPLRQRWVKGQEEEKQTLTGDCQASRGVQKTRRGKGNRKRSILREKREDQVAWEEGLSNSDLRQSPCGLKLKFKEKVVDSSALSSGLCACT